MTDIIKLLHVTDTHLCADPDKTLKDCNTRASFESVLDLAQQDDGWPPDAIVVTGDLSHDGTRKAYKAFADLLAPLQCPVYALPGNHDVPPVMYDQLARQQIDTTGSYQLGTWQLILLDCFLPGEVCGHFDAHELEQLDHYLDNCCLQHALVCLHQQPVPIGSAWLDEVGLDNPDEFFSVLDKHSHVRCVLWGHVHQDFVTERNGVSLMSSPSTCIQFAPGAVDFKLDTASAGYRWLELQTDGALKTRVHRIIDVNAIE